jgi:hypothetical protein
LKTVVHASAATLLRVLVLHFVIAWAGRLPPPHSPDNDGGEGDRKLLAGRAEFTQAVKLPRAMKKKKFEQDLELREVPHDAYAAVEFSHYPGEGGVPAHAVRGTFVLVDGPHGTCTVQMVAIMEVAGGDTTAPARERKNGTESPLPACLRRKRANE